MLGLKRNQRGDTIVEVLIVLAILGLSFSISSATANRSLTQARVAEEHNQAMGRLNSQVEMLRKALSDNVTLPTGEFCMTSPSTAQLIGNAACTTGINELYKPVISYLEKTPSQNSYYHLKVVWDGPGDTGQQSEEFKYKVDTTQSGVTSNSGGGFTIYTPSAPAPTPVVQNFSVAGRGYVSCESAEPRVNDGFDGCFVAGQSVYGRRAYKATYSLGASTSSVARTAALTINYNQYSGAGTVPPTNYNYFRLLIKFGAGDPGKTIHFGVAQGTASWTARQSLPVNVEIPANASVLEITWENNNGTDPDLQINSIQITGG